MRAPAPCGGKPRHLARLTSGVVVVDGKVISGRACNPRNEDCYIVAHDAKTGKELWKFYTAARSNEPGGDTWGGAPDATRAASTWGLAGAYDPPRRRLIWGVANPTPNTRANRHGGNSAAIPTFSPADLYSNSTIALDIDTGKLAWYYQHLPGDDWDEDYTNERTLLRTAVSPDPKFVKWINPDVKRGEQRNVAAMVGEGGGLFALDKDTGQFLWATPFPFDTPSFLISKIEGNGRVHLNENVMFKGESDRRVICFWNTRSYYPNSYHPEPQLVVRRLCGELPRHDVAGAGGHAARAARRHPARGPSLDTWAGFARVNMSTGEIAYLHKQRAPSQGAMLTTAIEPGVLGRPRSQVPRLRRRERQDALGDGAGRADPEQHDHLCGERQAVRGGVHRHRRHHRRPDRSGADQAEPSVQRARRLRIAVRGSGLIRTFVTTWHPHQNTLAPDRESADLWLPMTSIAARLAEELKIQVRQVEATIALLDEKSTVPFIARYRKEATGGLDDTQLRLLDERLTYLRELDARRETILKSIEERAS